MCPYEDGVQRCGRMAVPPHVWPPEERHARCDRCCQDHPDNLPGSCRVADLPVEEGVAQRHVAVHSERYGGPYGSVVGCKLGDADRVQQESGDIPVKNCRLQQEADEDDEELGENIWGCHCQEVVVQSLLSAGRQSAQGHCCEDVYWDKERSRNEIKRIKVMKIKAL